MLERNLFLNNLGDVNIDLPEEQKTGDSPSGLNKSGAMKFIPNKKAPDHIKNATTFINSSNGFATFLNRQDEIPRLSVLENYKQISRIMRNSFLKNYKVRSHYSSSD